MGIKMINQVFDYTSKHHMIKQGDRIVVGVSGGADSVCLLYVLWRLSEKIRYSVRVVHVNHGIRGKAADDDEQYVKELCLRLGVQFHPFHIDVKSMAKEQGLSEEEAGRNARYQAFVQVCKAYQCNIIAVAHNRNDNAETILFHLLRGTGMKGLTGIEPTRNLKMDGWDVSLIRPLLHIERYEIENYLHEEGISYRTDATNLTEDYSRNKIRNVILSYAVKEINSGAIGHINESASKIGEALEFIDSFVACQYRQVVRQEQDGCFIRVEALERQAGVIQKGLIRKALEQLSGHLKDLEAKHVEAVLELTEKQVGKLIHLPYGVIASREYEEIRLSKKEEIAEKRTVKEPMVPIQMSIPGTFFIPEKGRYLETQILNYEKNMPIPKNSCMKWFDYDKIENAVEIRNRREGDYIQINSLGGRKKLKDYFIDQKVPKPLRDSQILIADGSHIMWIPFEGERMSEKYKVGETTTKVLSMKLIDLEENKNDR
jgi:tRNA(Ile)-lysidine synthase